MTPGRGSRHHPGADGGRAWYRRAFGKTYLEIYSHRDMAEARALIQLLGREGLLPDTPVLDLGCGGGRHLTALAEVLWSPKELRDWDGFSSRLKSQFKRFDFMGVDYFKGPDE